MRSDRRVKGIGKKKRGKAEEAAKEAVGETSGVGGASGLNYTRTGLGEK